MNDKALANLPVAALGTLEECISNLEDTMRSLVGLTVMLNADRVYCPQPRGLEETEH
jgi:hypothetical protein